MPKRKLELAIQSYIEGDKDSFSTIYALQYKHVYYIALKHTKSKADAEDVVQEVFIELYKSLYKLNDVKNFNAWLNRVVYSCFIRTVRLKKQKMMVDLGENCNQEQIQTDPKVTDPKLLCQNLELMKHISDKIAELSKEQQMVAKLCFYEQLSVKEISERLSIPEGTVKSRINSIRKKLKCAVDQESYRVYYKNDFPEKTATKSFFSCAALVSVCPIRHFIETHSYAMFKEFMLRIYRVFIFNLSFALFCVLNTPIERDIQTIPLLIQNSNYQSYNLSEFIDSIPNFS